MVREYGGCVRLGLGSDLKTCSGNFDLLSGLPIIDFAVETGYVPGVFVPRKWGVRFFFRNGGMAAVWGLLSRFPSFRTERGRMGHPVLSLFEISLSAQDGGKDGAPRWTTSLPWAETGQAGLRRAMGAVCGFVGNWHYCQYALRDLPSYR